MSDGWTREYVVEVRHAELIAGSPFSHPFREEIVRCRDCEHYDSLRDGCWWFAHAERQPDYSWADEPSDVEPDGFCKWGERRDV